MSVKYSLVEDGETKVLTVLSDGNVYVADSTHPNFSKIAAMLLLDDPAVVDLFDVSLAVKERFESLSDRVSVSNGNVYFDGDIVDTSITRQILRLLESDLDYKPLVLFLENLAQNPNQHSREQLYAWLRDRDFTITPEGNFIAYKGVETYLDGYLSISGGEAIVNGVKQSGRIEQKVGDVVTMPRSNVAFDPNVGCSYGLHAGTWAYASDFARGAVLTVEINPRDVVSVPTDCDAQKLRVCRYKVLAKTDVEYVEPVYSFDDDDVVDYDGPPAIVFDNDNFDYFVPDSSAIKDAWYDYDNELAFVRFNASNHAYEHPCSKETWEQFTQAPSVGKFYTQNIKYNSVAHY